MKKFITSNPDVDMDGETEGQGDKVPCVNFHTGKLKMATI